MLWNAPSGGSLTYQSQDVIAVPRRCSSFWSSCTEKVFIDKEGTVKNMTKKSPVFLLVALLIVPVVPVGRAQEQEYRAVVVGIERYKR